MNFEKFLPESVFEFSLHGLHVRVLNQESGTELAELSKLNLPRAILIDLSQQVLEFLLSWSEAHGPHDLSKVIRRQEIHLLCVKQIKTGLQQNSMKKVRDKNWVAKQMLHAKICLKIASISGIIRA